MVIYNSTCRYIICIFTYTLIMKCVFTTSLLIIRRRNAFLFFSSFFSPFCRPGDSLDFYIRVIMAMIMIMVMIPMTMMTTIVVWY